MRRIDGLIAFVLLAGAARAQVASSASYRLDDFAFAGGGGGAASISFAGALALAPMSGGDVASIHYRASFGILGVWDPQPTNGPVIFGVTPDCGPLAGGTPVTVSGLNFQKAGAGATSVAFGGGLASSVAVLSDTLLQCVDPSGATGNQDVVVSNAIGSDTLSAGFHYTAGLQVYGAGTPGCAGPELLGASTCPDVNTPSFQLTCEKAPASALGLGLVSAGQDLAGSDPLALGVAFHVDLFAPGLIALDFTSDPTGRGYAAAPIPNDPTLVGASVYAQAVWFWSFACPLGPFNLSSSTGLKITFE